MRRRLDEAWTLFSFAVLLLGTIYVLFVVAVNMMKPLTGRCGTTLRLEEYVYGDWICRELE